MFGFIAGHQPGTDGIDAQCGRGRFGSGLCIAGQDGDGADVEGAQLAEGALRLLTGAVGEKKSAGGSAVNGEQHICGRQRRAVYPIFFKQAGRSAEDLSPAYSQRNTHAGVFGEVRDSFCAGRARIGEHRLGRGMVGVLLRRGREREQLLA